MLHGGSYIAYFSDALLRAAWVEGNLSSAAREPKWWRRSDPGMVMKHSAVEIRCVDDGFEIVGPPDDPEMTTRALDAIGHLGRVAEDRVK